jgi:hypothetical protein
VRPQRCARLGKNQNSATSGDGELVIAVRTRRPATWQRRSGEYPHSGIVAELAPQSGPRFLRAAVIEHDDVQMVDPALPQRGAYRGDRWSGLVPHRYQHRDRLGGLRWPIRGAVQVKRGGVDADSPAPLRAAPQRVGSS